MTISKANLQDLYALSPMQEGMLFHALSQPNSRAYFEQTRYDMSGTLNIELFRQSWQLLMNRHDALRSVFVHKKTDKLLQMVLKHREVDFSSSDLSALASKEQQQQIETYRQHDKAKGFDVSKDVLSRVHLFKIQPQQFVMIWSIHHIIADAWCVGIIYHDLLAFYQSLLSNQPNRLTPAPPYNRYIKWLAAQDKNAARDFWQHYLQNYSEAVSLYAQCSATTDYAYGVQRIQLSADDSTNLRLAATQAKVTLNTLMQSAWALLLRYHNQRDAIVFGVTVSGRPAAIAHVESIVGLFINTIPLRVSIDQQMRVIDLLQHAQQQAVATQPYDYYALADIQSLSALKQNLLNHILIFENVPQANAEQGSDLVIQQTDLFEHSHYPLMLSINPDHEIAFTFSYNQRVYSNAQISRVAEQLCHILRQLSQLDTFVTELNSLPATERAIIDSFSTLPAVAVQHDALPTLWAQQVAQRADAIAISDTVEQLSFAQLNNRANQLAHYLIEQYGVQAEDKIAVLLPRNVNLVVALWTIVKTGAAYVPLDSSYPKARLDYILKHSQSKLLLTDESANQWAIPSITIAAALAASTNNSNPDVALHPNHLAYLIYTSGSTGQPKGVMVEQGNVAAFCANMRHRFGFTASDKLLALTTVTFDISVLELLTAPTVGLHVMIADDEQVQNPHAIVHILKNKQITLLQATPSRLQWLIQAGGLNALANLRVILVGGEALPENIAEQLRQLPQTTVINVYGPTETTIWSSSKLLDDGKVTIGTALLGESINILSPQNELQAIGIAGEIVISGSGVSRGYYQDEQRTAKVFSANPFHAKQRIYRTGDMGRWLENGEIEFLGRKDEQVKIRGYRIELGEIEQRLLSHPSISQAAVVNSGNSDNAVLRAFIVASEALDSNALRDYLAQWLPDFMLPAQFTPLDDLPLNSNGKINRSALANSPVQATLATALAKPCRAARNAIEQQAVELWQQTLQQPVSSIDDDFFSLGGNSISAIQLTTQLSKLYEQDIALSTFLSNPSIAALSTALRGQQAAMVALNERIGQKNLFCFPPIMGFGVAFKELANYLPYACYAMDFVASPNVIEHSIAAIKQVQAQGSYVLLGYSLGCNLAFAVAEALQQQGERVQALLLIDGLSVSQATTLPEQELQHIIDSALQVIVLSASDSREKLQKNMRDYVQFALQHPNQSLLDSDIYCFNAHDNTINTPPFDSDWSALTQQKFASYRLEGNHYQLLNPPNLFDNASIIKNILNSL